MLKNYLLIFLLFFCVPSFLAAQSYSVFGRVADQTDTLPAIGSSVQLISRSDSTLRMGTATSNDGNFQFTGVTSGIYQLRINYVGSKAVSQTVNVISENVNLGTIIMKADANQLENVLIEGKINRAEQLGDTTQFNAAAFKTNPDATAEDLLTKMPGVTSDANGLKVNGETVTKVYVDGKPFFGDDPNVAIKNLPAEIIDKIQVFDKQSDQSQFTGFDDGNTDKTVNIITKKGKNNGEFGKIYAGYGTDSRYSAGGNANYFNGDQRISLIGLSNNINQQNFSSQDLVGVSSSGGGGRGGGRGGGGGSSGSNNFMVGGQSGITKSNSIGLNYSDQWGKKIKVSGSYFFNNTDNVNTTKTSRDYYQDSTYKYSDSSTSESKNNNHRINFRLEYTIDSFNSLFITPSFSYQQNNSTTGLLDTTFLGDLGGSANVMNRNNTDFTGFSFSNNITFNHRFHKKGRTISLSAITSANDKSGNGSIYSLNDYVDSSSLLDQHYDLTSKSNTISGSLRYTEPVGKYGQLMVNYSPSYSRNTSDKETNNYDPNTVTYTDFDTVLSNKYINTYVRQSGGFSYRYNNKVFMIMAGVNAQSAQLNGNQDFPYDFTLEKSFTNILPTAMLNYRPSKGVNIRMYYRTSTNAPSISQLQRVVDITNPLLLKTGNPDLKQDFEHNITIRYGKTNTVKASSFFIFANVTVAQNYIGNATLIPTKDTVVSGVTVSKGGQITLPVNVSGYVNARTFATYGLPLDVIKSNLNLSGGITYGRSPSRINSLINYSSNYAPNLGLVVSSNVSENVDFTFAYNGSYNVIRNTAQSTANNNYYNQTLSFKINLLVWKHLVINTNLNHNLYTGLNEGYNQQFFIWNAYMGYKFLKSRALEARITAFDLLKQNKSITVNPGDIYREQTTTQVLTRYFLFTLNYTFRYFKSGSAPVENNNNLDNQRPTRGGWNGGGGGNGGGRPPGGF